MTSPEQIPHLISSATRWLDIRSTLSSLTFASVSSAVLTARSASSSWLTSAPKTAMTASPMNFSVAPPCASTQDLAAHR